MERPTIRATPDFFFGGSRDVEGVLVSHRYEGVESVVQRVDAVQDLASDLDRGDLTALNEGR